LEARDSGVAEHFVLQFR